MSRPGKLAVAGAVAICFAGWIAFTNRADTPAPDVARTSSLAVAQVDSVTRAQQEELENRKAQERIAELARLDAKRAQADHAFAESQQARASLQATKNQLWSGFISTNWTAYEKVHEAALLSHDHITHCTLCDGSGLMPFCVLCDGSGKCPACKGTGKAYGDQVCSVCLGNGTCYLCLGKGRMPCPFCDDGTVYADMAPPATSLPLAGFARSRPALAKQNSGPGAFSNDPRPAPAQVSVAEPVAAAPAPEPQPGGASIGNQILAALALLLVGGIALPRLSPALGNLLNRASDKPRPAGPVPQDVLADDKAFSAFVVALQNPVANEAKLPLPATSETRAKPQLSPAEQLERYFETAPNLLASMRAGVSEFCHVQTDRQRQEILAQLAERITTLRGLADPPELLPIRQLALGVQGLLKQLAEKPSEVTPSNLRTAAGALVLLESISSANLKADIATNPPVRLLVVDDDAVSRLAVALALKKAFPQPDVASDGEAALALAEKQAYDVIFLDVEMPGMDGYELCTRIHETALNHSTPVIFVTRHGDFDSRAKSTRSGAQDLIAKPFLSFEITLKALTFVIRERLKPAQEGAPSATAREREGKEMLQPGADFHKSFFACAPTHLEFLREQLRALTSAGTDGSREESLGNLYTSAQSFAAEAERAELRAVARLGCALVTLLKKIIEKPEQLANSNLEALAATLDLLEELCAESLNPSLSDPEVRTLIVDDDPIVLRVLSSAVQAACSKPETVANGDEAAARAAEQEFDLILLDVDLPGVDGFKTCRRIHNTARNRSTPVIFVTGFGDQESRRKAVGLGCRGFIVKPAIASEITLRTLTFAVRARLEKLRHPRSAARQPEPVLA